MLGIHDRVLGPRQVPRAVRRVFRSLGPGTIAVDCGANVGRVTELLAARGADVYAFEPNPYAFEILQRRFSQSPRVRCLQLAVAATSGPARLHLHVDAASDQLTWSTGSSLFAAKPNVDVDSFVEVETIGLNSFLESLESDVQVLKLDVEGAEVEILEQLLTSGRLARVEHVLVEMHDDRIPGLEARGRALRERLSAPELRHVRLDWI